MSAFVTTEGYQYYWERAKEHTSASYIRLHFRHFISEADSANLSKLHAAINL